MTKILIINNTKGFMKKPYNFPSVELENYVDSYFQIMKHIYSSNNASLTFVVDNSFCMNAFRKMALQYGEKNILIENFSIREELKKQLLCDIPEYISDEDIHLSDLLSKNFTYSRGMMFEDIMIENFVGSLWKNNRFPFYNFFEAHKQYKFSNHRGEKEKVLEKVMLKKISDWKENLSKEKACFVNNYFDNIEEFYDSLVSQIILKNYPDELKSEIGAKFRIEEGIFNDVLIPKKISIPIVLTKKIKQFLNSNYFDISINKHLKMLSGLAECEYEFVDSLLRGGNIKISNENWSYLEEKFIGFGLKREYYTKEIKKPNLEGTSININWLDWTINEYLPYKNSLNNFNEIMEYTKSFGDLFYENYSNLLVNLQESKMIYNFFPTYRNQLLKDKHSLIIILDNFNFENVSNLEEEFAMADFKLCNKDYMFSMLPSITKVSKRALLSANSKYIKGDYNKLIKNISKSMNLNVRYLSNNLQNLSNISFEKEHEVLVMNITSTDEIMHSNQIQKATSTKDIYDLEIRNIIRFVSNLFTENNDFKIYVISDHGSINIPNDFNNMIPNDFVKMFEEDIFETSGRYLAVSDDLLSKLSDNQKDMFYIINRNIYKTEYNFLIAKSYDRFLRNSSNNFTHGGVSPEEIIIPILKFEKADI